MEARVLKTLEVRFRDPLRTGKCLEGTGGRRFTSRAIRDVTPIAHNGCRPAQASPGLTQPPPVHRQFKLFSEHSRALIRSGTSMDPVRRAAGGSIRQAASSCRTRRAPSAPSSGGGSAWPGSPARHGRNSRSPGRAPRPSGAAAREAAGLPRCVRRRPAARARHRRRACPNVSLSSVELKGRAGPIMRLFRRSPAGVPSMRLRSGTCRCAAHVWIARLMSGRPGRGTADV